MINEKILTFKCYRKRVNLKKIVKYINLIIIIFCISIIIPGKSCAEDNIMSSTKEQFNIGEFITESQKYMGDAFEEIDLKNVLNQAVQGKIDNKMISKILLKVMGKEIHTSLKTLISILVIIIIHGILKSITDNLENKNISQIVYFVQYILIVTLMMTNFTEIIKLVQNTADDMVGFINLLLPLLMTLILYTGSITTSSILEPIIIFAINLIGNLIKDFLLPVMLIIVVFSIISKISNKFQIDKLSKLLKSGVTWTLGIILTVFVGIVSLEGSLSSSVDGITAKTAKTAVSSVIPVVGKILGDVVDSVLGCGGILKNAVGIVGVVVVISICIVPIIRISTLCIIYSFSSAFVQPIADEKIVKVLEEMAGIFKVLLGILCSLSVMLIIGITLVIKISNSGMMYR